MFVKYPVPCINIVVQTSALVKAKYITEEERVLLNEIYDYNPLLFDFVVRIVLYEKLEYSLL